MISLMQLNKNYYIMGKDERLQCILLGIAIVMLSVMVRVNDFNLVVLFSILSGLFFGLFVLRFIKMLIKDAKEMSELRKKYNL